MVVTVECDEELSLACSCAYCGATSLLIVALAATAIDVQQILRPLFLSIPTHSVWFRQHTLLQRDYKMAETWDPEELSAILESIQPNLLQADHDPTFPLRSQECENTLRAIAPSSPEGRSIRTLHGLLEDKLDTKTAADILAFTMSRQCSSESCYASELWGNICLRGETWPEQKLARLADLVVEMAKLSYALPDYPGDSDDPVQGSSSFKELPGFGHELVSRLQGKKQPMAFCKLQSDIYVRFKMLRTAFRAT